MIIYYYHVDSKETSTDGRHTRVAEYSFVAIKQHDHSSI